MGQYYTPIILRIGQNDTVIKGEQFYSHDYSNGLKLTEHSWDGNNFVETVMKQLYKKPGRLFWVGDYAEQNDLSEDKRKYADDVWKIYNKRKYSKPKEAATDFSKGKFIINYDKGWFIDLEEYRKNAPKDEPGDDGWQMAPLPLLTALGNGRGGGDYEGINMEYIGSWAGDLIELADERPREDFRNVSDYAFIESY